MNLRFVANQLGLLLLGFGGIMLVIAGLFFIVESLLRHDIDEAARIALLLSAGGGLVGGGILWGLTRHGPRYLGRREAMLLVAMSWILGAAFAALPYLLWAHLSPRTPDDHPFRSAVSCYFEAMSGLTTTGATVLTDIEAIPRSLLLWRAMTHWLGGLGIVVLFVAVLPNLGVGGKKLFRLESPGPAPEGLQPQIRDTARVLWYIYLALTGAQIAALCLAGMDLFDSICHTCATLATGGFSTRNASIGAYSSPAITLIVIIFMVLAGLNFGLYFQVIRGRTLRLWRDPEARLYLLLLLLATAVIFVAVANEQTLVLSTGERVPTTSGRALLHALFAAVSIQTTTGFVTADFELWPFAAKAVLILLMFIGGSAGSTAGGIKVIRIWITLKVVLVELERVFRPHVIRPVRVGGGTVDDMLKIGTLAYVLGVVVLFAAGAVAVMLLEQLPGGRECTFTTASTASLATLCTIGPGLGGVGALENYGWFSAPSKVVLCLQMVLGRLEIFAIIVLFSPRFWRTR